MNASSMLDRTAALALAALLGLAAPAALAADGTAPGGGGCETCMTSGAGGAPTYYQTLAPDGSLAALESASPSLPTALQVDDSSAGAFYTPTASDGKTVQWEVTLRDFVRNHERVDAVYQMVLVLPLPANADGSPAFTALDRAIGPREGSESNSVPLIYGGEKLLLKRDVALEKALLPGLVGDPAAGQLPSLAGTGYAYTLWDTVVVYDALHASTLQGWARFRYQTASSVVGPDTADERLKAYLVTWVPALRGDVRPWAIRMDVAQ